MVVACARQHRRRGADTKAQVASRNHAVRDGSRSCASHGSAYVRQAGKNLPIQWGVYVVPKYKIVSHFVAKVYADGVKIDGKNQDYEPHGSVSADRTRKYSGKILEITGTAVNGDDTLSFSAKCIIA